MAKLILADEFPPISHEEWAKGAAASIKAETIDKLVSTSPDGLKIAPVYPQLNKMHQPLCSDEQNGWEIIQRVDIPDIVAANKQILEDLLKGATGISIVLPGSANANGYGVAVTTVDDFKKLFKNVELDLISVRLDAGPSGRHAGLDLLQVYKDRNYDLSRCKFNLGLDPIGAIAKTGACVARNVLSNRMHNVFVQTQKAGHKSTIFCSDGRLYHEAGATPSQELGIALATILQHLQLLVAGGINLEKALGQIGVLLSADADQFSTIAKLRAMKILWHKICNVYGVGEPRLNIEVETSARMMTRYDPHVNLLRTTTAVFAAGVGGASSICVLPFSHRLGLGDDFGRRMARNSQIILQQESCIGTVCDAAAGSGYVEELTTALAEQAWVIMQEIETNGGMIASLISGHIQKSLAKSLTRSSVAIANRKQSLVGVSAFANLERTKVNLLDYKLPTNYRAGEPVQQQEAEQQICQPLKNIFYAQGFEELRDRVAKIKTPVIQLLSWGTRPGFAVRATKMKNFFAIAGIETTTDINGSGVGCICSPDFKTLEDVNSAMSKLHDQGYEKLFIDSPIEGSSGSNTSWFINLDGDVLSELERVVNILGDRA